jgi:bacillithiol biosynthesis cysteine-adding enzyme BshC
MKWPVCFSQNSFIAQARFCGVNRTIKADMELIVSRPRGARVVQDYLSGEGASPAFFGRRFDDFSSFIDKAAEVDRRFDRAARERAVEAIIIPPDGDASRLDAFVEKGGYMVTTGQQPGLYGGPMYSLHKALTAVRLAETLEKRLGSPVIPVFWVASDDHDWAEANHADLIGTDNELRRYELPPLEGDRSPPLHRIEFGPEASDVLESFVQSIPDNDFSAEYVELLRSGFSEGCTMPGGFHVLMQKLLGPFGLFFTDAAHPAVKQHSAELLLAELERAEELEGVLSSTADALEASGYDLQVPIMPSGVNLFLEGPAGRERIYRDGDGFRLRTSGEPLHAAQIRKAAETDPTALSPNVLFRPVVESAVFPTLAYVGGPGEMAYFAQLRAYFEAHDIEMPIVFPRFAATIVETKIRKVLTKFDVGIESLNRPFHEISTELAREGVPEDVRAAIGKLRGSLGAGVGELQKAATAVDPTLKGPVQHLRSSAFAALDDVEKKVTQAVKRESEITLSQLEKAKLHLFPNGKPAERVQSPIYYLTRYGGSVLEHLHEAFVVNLD